MSRGSCKVYEVGAEAMYGLVQHDKPDIKSPLLKTAPAWVV